MNTRILNLSNAPYPKAEVQSINAENGLLMFAYLDAYGKRVDSGNSVARFIPSWMTDEHNVRTYIAPTDAELIAAIAVAAQ